MICEFILILSSHDGIKFLSNRLQLEPCNVMLKIISDMSHWYDMWNTIVIEIKFLNEKKMICAFTLIISNHYGKICLCYLLQLEPCNVMFKMISDIIAHWYDMRNTIVIAINFCNAKKMISAFMFIISKHCWIKCLSNLL